MCLSIKNAKPAIILILFIFIGLFNSLSAQNIIDVATDGNLEIVKQLIKNDPDLVNFKDDDNCTALMYACSGGHLDVVKFLIENNADIEQKDNDGDPPLIWALIYFKLDVVKYLLEQGASFETLQRRNKQIIAYLTENGRADMVQILLNRNADITYSDAYYKRTLLHIASINGNLEIVKMLINSGIDLNLKDLYGHTSLYYADKLGYTNISRELKRNGAIADSESIAKDPQEYLKMNLGEKEAILWYLNNNGYAIKTKNNFVIFDYWEKALKPDVRSLINGHINPDEIKDLNTTVFITHPHRDHYDTVIYEWEKTNPDIKYVFGWNEKSGDNYVNITEPLKFHTVGDFKIYSTCHTYGNDPESSFLIKVDGLTIYNTGDLLLYRTVEESFYKNIDTISVLNENIDIAFVCTNTLASFTSWKEGLIYIANKLKPKVLILCHSDNYEYLFIPLEKFLKENNVTPEIAYPESRGDMFIFKNNKMTRMR